MFTKDGYRVVVEEGSHVADHKAFDLLWRAVPLITAKGETVVARNVDTGEYIGKDHCTYVSPWVNTPAIKFYFAKRGNREGYSRMVEGMNPIPTRHVSVVLVWNEKGDCYNAITCYAGLLAPREPWDPTLQDDPAALTESKAFWAAHAIIHDNSTTLTRFNPVPAGWEYLPYFEGPDTH